MVGSGWAVDASREQAGSSTAATTPPALHAQLLSSGQVAPIQVCARVRCTVGGRCRQITGQPRNPAAFLDPSQASSVSDLADGRQSGAAGEAGGQGAAAGPAVAAEPAAAQGPQLCAHGLLPLLLRAALPPPLRRPLRSLPSARCVVGGGGGRCLRPDGHKHQRFTRVWVFSG
jgi:hypothetical protein